MPKMKMHRKSTSIDMTAMCDVAFLLLSFFIFTAKFKKSEEVAISTPNSVSTDSLATKNKLNVYCNIAPDGKLLIGMEDEKYMADYGKILTNTIKGVRPDFALTDVQLEAFGKKTAVGMDYNELKNYLTSLGTNQIIEAQKGIPIMDSTNNQLNIWIDAMSKMYSDSLVRRPDLGLNIFIKADRETPFEVVDKVLETFVKKGQDQFKLVTTPEDAPVGTALYYKNRGIAPPKDL
jgi:biopolymer transport protein ExbD